MASAITTYGASYLLNVSFGQRQIPPPYFYVALLTATPGTQADGTLLQEPSIPSGYNRVLMINDQTLFGTAIDGVTTSTSEVMFGVATDDWPLVTHYALCDSLVGGNVYLYGSFNLPRRISAGDQARIPAQALSLSVTSLTTAQSSTF